MHSTIAGVVPMLPTPFDEDGRIIWDDFAPVIRHQLRYGVHALAALGLGGEASRLSVAERFEVTKTVLGIVAGAVPVVIGTSADDTKTACALAEEAARSGAAAVMVAPPNRSGISRAELWDHYTAVCDAATSVEVMVQDAPAFLDVALGEAFLCELSEARKNVRYAKSEAYPAAERVAELRAALNERVGIFGGASGLHFLDVLEAGAIGMIPGCEAPAQFVGIFDAFAAGDRERAARQFARLQPLLVFETQGLDIFIASSKAILKRLGLIRSDALRAKNPLGSWSRRVLDEHVQRALGQ